MEHKDHFYTVTEEGDSKWVKPDTHPIILIRKECFLFSLKLIFIFFTIFSFKVMMKVPINQEKYLPNIGLLKIMPRSIIKDVEEASWRLMF